MSAYDFMSDIPMDRAHTLDQLTGRFQTLKDGLPELVKNSKDQYARLGIQDREKRVILVLVNTKESRVGVLDFAGADPAAFEGWTTWSSRIASRAEMAEDIEGGHGNGGKSFMVRGSTKEAFMDSCANGFRTKMGFDNTDPRRRYLPGWAKDGTGPIRNLAEPNAKARLDDVLRGYRIRFSQLPEVAQEAFRERQSFTIVQVDGIREWENRRKATVKNLAAAIPESLLGHAQAALTIETCSVHVVVDGRALRSGQLEPEHPDAMAGFEDLDLIVVPETLLDPHTNESVDTGAGTPAEKYLHLRTSAKQLRLSDDRKALNVIRVRNRRNVVANWSLASLVPRAESGFILGELRVPALLGEHLSDSHRSQLSDTPLARALEAWVSVQVEDLAKRIQRALAKETKKSERDKAHNALERFRALMREYLDSEQMPGDEQDGDRGNRGVEPVPPPVPSRATVITEIVLEPGRHTLAVALGSSVPLVVRCYGEDDKGARAPVVGRKLDLQQDENLLTLDGRTLIAVKEGRTRICLRDPDSDVTSNEIEVEVVRCIGVDILVPEEPLLRGQRTRLMISYQTASGPRDDLLVDGAVDEEEMGRISRSGTFTAGMVQGTATVRVRFGSALGDTASAIVEIGPEAVPPRPAPGGGADIPLILLCGDQAPGLEEYPEDQRSHHGGDVFPTIIADEPPFTNVVWINPHSKEASRVRRGRGPTGVTGIGTQTFLQFVSLKCFEILKRLKVRQELRGQAVNDLEFTRLLAQAEMDCAGFVDAAYDLAQSLTQEGSE